MQMHRWAINVARLPLPPSSDVADVGNRSAVERITTVLGSACGVLTRKSSGYFEGWNFACGTFSCPRNWRQQVRNFASVRSATRLTLSSRRVIGGFR